MASARRSSTMLTLARLQALALATAGAALAILTAQSGYGVFAALALLGKILMPYRLVSRLAGGTEAPSATGGTPRSGLGDARIATRLAAAVALMALSLTVLPPPSAIDGIDLSATAALAGFLIGLLALALAADAPGRAAAALGCENALMLAALGIPGGTAAACLQAAGLCAAAVLYARARPQAEAGT
jgi:hypothetical protein